MRKSTLVSNDAYPFIATWNGSNANTATGLKVNAVLKQVVISQIGAQAAALFENDFINYNDGFILCQNIPDNLNTLFAATANTTTKNFRKTLRFTPVKMPATFKGQKGNLSSNYEYGERLRVSVSVESVNNNQTVIKGRQIPTINGTPVQLRSGPIKNNSGVNFLVYRDANMASRTLKSQSGGGGGIGVWS